MSHKQPPEKQLPSVPEFLNAAFLPPKHSSQHGSIGPAGFPAPIASTLLGCLARHMPFAMRTVVFELSGFHPVLHGGEAIGTGHRLFSSVPVNGAPSRFGTSHPRCFAFIAHHRIFHRRWMT